MTEMLLIFIKYIFEQNTIDWTRIVCNSPRMFIQCSLKSVKTRLAARTSGTLCRPPQMTIINFIIEKSLKKNVCLTEGGSQNHDRNIQIECVFICRYCYFKELFSLFHALVQWSMLTHAAVRICYLQWKNDWCAHAFYILIISWYSRQQLRALSCYTI